MNGHRKVTIFFMCAECYPCYPADFLKALHLFDLKIKNYVWNL